MAPFHLQSVILTDILVATNEISKKVFGLPTGGKAPATTVAKLHLNIRTPANIVDIIPTLETTLISGSKFSDAGYISVYDKNEVNFYEKSAVTITENQYCVAIDAQEQISGASHYNL